MKTIKIKPKNLRLPSLRATGVFRVATECGCGPTKGSESPHSRRWARMGVGLLLLLFISCTSKPVPGYVAEEDSLCIDTVASLDEVMQPDTIVVDSLAGDSL